MPIRKLNKGDYDQMYIICKNFKNDRDFLIQFKCGLELIFATAMFRICYNRKIYSLRFQHRLYLNLKFIWRYQLFINIDELDIVMEVQ